MSGYKGSTFCNDWLNLVFKGTGIANIADNAASSPLASLYVALHTADPTASGSQTSSEISYTGYSRVAVTRGAGFTVTGSSVSPASSITFGAMTAGAGGTVTFFSVGTSSSGAGKILYAGPVSPTISVTTGVTPQLTGSTACTEA